MSSERLERAQGELTRCSKRIEELMVEIPQLKELVMATKNFLGISIVKEVKMEQTARPRRPNFIAGIPADRVPENIRKFLSHIPQGAAVSNVESRVEIEPTSDDDSLLPSLSGEEVLP